MATFTRAYLEVLLEEVKKKGKSLFDIKDVHTIIKSDINKAKEFVMKKAKSASEEKHITPQGFKKIVNIVNAARDSENLAMRITNFILAHPGEGLKVVNVEKERKKK